MARTRVRFAKRLAPLVEDRDERCASQPAMSDAQQLRCQGTADRLGFDGSGQIGYVRVRSEPG